MREKTGSRKKAVSSDPGLPSFQTFRAYQVLIINLSSTYQTESVDLLVRFDKYALSCCEVVVKQFLLLLRPEFSNLN